MLYYIRICTPTPPIAGGGGFGILFVKSISSQLEMPVMNPVSCIVSSRLPPPPPHRPHLTECRLFFIVCSYVYVCSIVYFVRVSIYVRVRRMCSGLTPIQRAFKTPLWVGSGTEMRTQNLRDQWLMT